MLAQGDVHIEQGTRLSPFLEVRAEVLADAGGTPVVVSRYRRGLDKAPESDIKPLKALGLRLKEAVVSGQHVSLPIVAYYGTGRGQIKAPERRRNFQKTYEAWDCYHGSLEPATDFKSFFAWYDLMEDEERREREKRRDFGYRLPQLEAVRRALADFVGLSGYTNPRIEIHPLRFVVDETAGPEGGPSRQLRIEQMSDGYKIIIAMVADIASRLAQAARNNPGADPLKGSGIVLIDEADLHLHPRWQMHILGQMAHAFPNVQFIVTTHSPVIAVGAGEAAQIVRLPDSADGDLQEASGETANYDVAQLLLSNLFGLPSLLPPSWADKKEERDALLQLADRTPQQERRLGELDAELRQLPSGESPAEIEAGMLLRKLAEEFKVGI